MDKTFYNNYLKSPQWQAKREVYFARRGRYCRVCKTTFGQIQLHHLTYERLGHENLADLIALCAECHKGAEKVYRIMGGDRRIALQIFIRSRKNDRVRRGSQRTRRGSR